MVWAFATGAKAKTPSSFEADNRVCLEGEASINAILAYQVFRERRLSEDNQAYRDGRHKTDHVRKQTDL